MTTTESTLVKENDIIMIMKTIEAVRGVAAEAEKGVEIIDMIGRIDLVGTDPEKDTEKVEIDTETDLDREKDRAKDLRILSVLDQVIDLDRKRDLEKYPGTLIVLDLVRDLEIEKDLAIEEKNTGKTKSPVDAAVKVPKTGMTVLRMKGEYQMVALAQNMSNQKVE
mmetsp:Transcript_24966/g.58581  ORF Transcript_24966/g.58581 Transcript_24966/m.58581 type:complete len:166 (-) Transcript_24966:182-679(-)